MSTLVTNIKGPTPEHGDILSTPIDSRRRLSALVASIPSGLLAFDVSETDIKLFYIAPELMRFLPACPGGLMPALCKGVDPDDLPLIRAALRMCADTGDVADVAFKLNGEKWVRLRASRMGKMDMIDGVLLLAVVSAVTSQDPDELRNKLYLRQMEHLLDNKYFSSFEVDMQTNALSFSETFFLLYKCSERTVVKSIDEGYDSELIQPESRKAYVSMCRAMKSAVPEGTAKLGLLCRDGSRYIPVKIKWKTVFDGHGKPVRIVGIVEPAHPASSASSHHADADISALKAQISLLETYFKRSEEYLKELRRYRHDRKNNIISLSALINSGDIEGARKYIAAVGARLEQDTPLINTENPAIDSLLSEKIRQAMSKGIEVSHTVGLAPDIKIDMQDLCIAVGCCMDNAIEACERAAGKFPKTFISLTMIEKRGVITFRLRNTSVTEKPKNGKMPRSSKSDSGNHGFGLKNVSSVVDKYHGYLELIPEPGVFTTNFTLFLNM